MVPIINSQTTSKNLLDLLLKNRHVLNPEEFLQPPFPQLHLRLQPAIKLINKAITNQKNILIYGDYDVDGITATAILWQAIHETYPNIIPFIPHREIDGYGFKAKSFFRFQQEKKIKFDLLITVDNGIVADAEFAKIKAKQETKIIVTDHHLINSQLKSVDFLIHSTKISGAAVSWFLAHKLNSKADLGLAALGTVADCLPLINTSRSIVVHGLQSLRLNPSPGIKKLIQISGLQPGSISVYDLGFFLGPRINAIGRLADPTDALRLLCSQSSSQTDKYAQSLNSYNQDRQLLQKESTILAEKLFTQTKSHPSSSLIFIYEPSFNPGIIGLVAGYLTEKYHLPAIVLSSNDGLAKGSCRSIAGLNIIEVLRQFSNLFVDLGGHSLAAGFTIKVENIKKLQTKLTREINKKFTQTVFPPSWSIDAEMTISAVNIKNYHTIQKLSPFGIGNSEPLFLLKNLTINFKKIIGSTGDHLKLKLDNIDAIAFKKGELFNTLDVGDKIDVIASLDINTWNNVTTPQLIIKEIVSVLK